MLVVANANHLWSSTLSYSSKCTTQTDINQLHSRILKTGLVKNPLFTKKLILNFSSSPYHPLIQFARHLLFEYSRNRPDPFLWNVVMNKYSHGNEPENAFQVFVLMLENGVLVDEYSFSLILKACARTGFIEQGIQIHGLMMKFKFRGDLVLQNCLIHMYLKCGCAEFGRQVFDKMSNRDSVTYNSMIDGYVKCGMVGLARDLFEFMPTELRNLISWNALIGGYVKLEDGFELARELFEKMPERDLVSWNLMLDCCVKCGEMESACDLFDKMPKRDVVSWGIMINGYAKMGCVDIARGLFDGMAERDVISCNAMMAGYVKNGRCVEALKVLYDMLSESNLNLAPDDGTLVISLCAIAQLGCIDEGVAIHWYMKENGFVLDGKLGVALIDMYAKCGSVESAMSVFDDIDNKNVDHWNAMIGGLAIHGFGDLAFDLYMEMERQSLQPDDITFIAVLNACGHAGLVKEGMICFEIMRRVHEVEPKPHHYGCIVDILSRAGHVEAATRFVRDMPIEPNDVVWRTLLSACNNHEKLNIGELVAEHLIEHNSDHSSYYVLLSNMYARFGMWEYVRMVRSMMRERDLNKIPGCSWIELEGTVHEFSVGDTSHQQVKEIYSTLYRSSTLSSGVASSRV